MKGTLLLTLEKMTFLISYKSKKCIMEIVLFFLLVCGGCSKNS